jgi:hypothetical protein
MRSEGSGMKIMILYHLYQGPDTLAELREYKTKSKSVSCITILIFKHKCKHMISKHLYKGGDSNDKVDDSSIIAFSYLVFSDISFT